MKFWIALQTLTFTLLAATGIAVAKVAPNGCPSCPLCH